MASQKRFELPTHGLEGRCSILLSYRRVTHFIDGALALIPYFTHNRMINRRTYPRESGYNTYNQYSR